MRCSVCQGTGHYDPVYPHCEPCRCNWYCYWCWGTGTGKEVASGGPVPVHVEHLGQDKAACAGCRAVREQ